MFPFSALFGIIPDLHLRISAQINTAVGERNRFVFEQKLNISEFLVGRRVRSLAIVDKLPIFDRPVLLKRHHIGFALGRTLLIGHRPELARIKMPKAVPAIDIFTVKKSTKTFRRFDNFSARNMRKKTDRKSTRLNSSLVAISY